MNEHRPPYLAAVIASRGDLPPVRRHAGPHHGVLGHERVYRDRVHPRDPAPAREPAIRGAGEGVDRPAVAAGASGRGASEPAGRPHFRCGERVLLPGGPPHRMGAAGRSPAGAGGGGGKRAAGRDGVYRVEPVRGQREGLHGQRAGDRRGDLAGGALAGPARRTREWAPPAGGGLPDDPGLVQPHHVAPAGAGPGPDAAHDGAEGANAPRPVDARAPPRRGRPVVQRVPADSRSPAAGDQRR